MGGFTKIRPFWDWNIKKTRFTAAILQLKSDHFGIEIRRSVDIASLSLPLKSDHFGIEIIIHPWRDENRSALKSDHFGIEI